jgi:hypothetical protein
VLPEVARAAAEATAAVLPVRWIRRASPHPSNTDKYPATNDTTCSGWCRIMGLAPRLLFTTCLVITRNQRITIAWDRRQEADARRAAADPPSAPQTLTSLATAPP